MLTTERQKAVPFMEARTRKLPVYKAPAKAAYGSSQKGLKITIVGAFLISLAALVGTGILYQSLEIEREDRAALEATKIQLQDQVDALQRESERLHSQIARLREQLKTYSVENAKIKKELDQRYVDINQYKARLQSLEMTDSVSPFGVEETSEVMAEAPVEAAIEEPLAVQEPVVTETPAEESAEETLEAPAPLTVERTQNEASFSAPASRTQSADAGSANMPQVMTINRKFNFVVINMGLKDNLKMGDRLEVLRDGELIANLQIEKLYDRFAAATILQELKKFKIEKGDNVRLSQS